MKTENILVVSVLILIGILAFYPLVQNGMLQRLISNPATKTASTCELFMSGVAQDFKQPQLCAKISSDAVGDIGGFSPPGYQIDYARSTCYLAAAVEAKDESLCANVKPISTPTLDGSKINQANCIQQVQTDNQLFGGSLATLSDDQLGTIMNQLGYNEQTLLQAEGGAPIVASSSFNPVGYDTTLYHLFQSIRTTSSFINAVEQLPSYSEPFSSTVAAIPNDQEYLYDLVATSVNKPDLCGKISPNVYIFYPDMVAGYDNSLRDECYHDVAVNFLNSAVCNDITLRNSLTIYLTSSTYANPSSGKSSSVSLNNVNGCKLDVAVAGLPNHPYGPHSATSTQYDGTYLGGYDSFVNVLNELGYQPTSTTYGWNDYLQDLELTSGFEGQRADFLNKVNNLQCQN